MPSIGSGSRIPPGGTAGNVLIKNSTTDFDAAWQTSAALKGPGVAPGGTTGQVLVKNSSTDYDTSWAAAPSGGGSGSPTVFYSPTQPTAMAVGDVWISTSGVY